MKLIIELPKEFERDFKENALGKIVIQDSLDRMIYDIEKGLHNGDTRLSGNYEKEILEALKVAFENAERIEEKEEEIEIEDR